LLLNANVTRRCPEARAEVEEASFAVHVGRRMQTWRRTAAFFLIFLIPDRRLAKNRDAACPSRVHLVEDLPMDSFLALTSRSDTLPTLTLTTPPSLIQFPDLGRLAELVDEILRIKPAALGQAKELRRLSTGSAAQAPSMPCVSCRLPQQPGFTSHIWRAPLPRSCSRAG
jgi:hypothetical protein